MLTTRTFVALAPRAWSLSCVLLIGCAERRHAPLYESGQSSPGVTEICATPAEGCPCPVPGALTDCGEIVERTDSYITCTQGVRVCSDQGTWGVCAGDLVTRESTSRDGNAVLAFGSASGCSEQNPCDPLCRQIVDTGVGITGLSDGLCSTASGISACRTCGYSGPVSDLPYASMPAEWRRMPSACAPTDDRCPMDSVCNSGTCETRGKICAAPAGTCPIDLTLAKACIEGASTYHLPLCNRGSVAVTSPTVRIGVDSRSTAISECTTAIATALPGFPDSGIISFQLAEGQRIEPGTCVDVNPANSTSVSLDLSGNRAFVANYDAQLTECNACNNSSALIVSSPTGEVSRCASCVGLECQQVSRHTTLRGVVYDPIGTRPVAGAIVYVPNAPVAPLVDGVACDTCDSLVSGSPLVWTTTGGDGDFVLPDMPSDVAFPLVLQIGRWRRQARVAPIPAGETRWIDGYDPATTQFSLSTGSSEPEPVEPERRLRLPRTQYRCNSRGCAGEGDIPKIALIMGDADPLQCTLRRIGIADTEFTTDWSYGRVHLFQAAGMRQFGARMGYGNDTALLSGKAGNGKPLLNAYSMLVAPCDRAFDSIHPWDDTYQTSPYASGPSYNAAPTGSISALERQTVKDFVAAGGRLLTTDLMSTDLVYLNYDPPAPAHFATTDSTPLSSPYDPSTNPYFATELARYAAERTGFSWNYVTEEAFNPLAPALYLFGNNVRFGGARAHEPLLAPSERIASIGYDIDSSHELGAELATWGAATGLTNANGRVRWREWSSMISTVRPARGAIALLRGDTRDESRFQWADSQATNPPSPTPRPCLQGALAGYDCSNDAPWGGDHIAMFQFDASVGALDQCGRVGVTSGHVSQHQCHNPSLSRDQSYCDSDPATTPGAPVPDCACYSFPASADRACGDSQPNEEELAFEFLLFSTSRCVGDLSPPVRGLRLARASATRDFEADCAPEEQVVWQLFSWQATVPIGARIDFYAATAPFQSELDQSSYVGIGTANRTTTTWTAGEHTVDQYLRLSSEGPLVSQRWLRVKSSFEPNGTESPTLSEWRVVFNCK